MAVVALGLLGSGTATTAGTTLAVVNTTGAVIPAGTFIHLTGTWDNVSATAPTITCSTIGGATATANNATPIGSGVSATAGAGIWHTCFRAVTTASIASGATIATLTSNQSAVKRAAHCEGWSGALATLRGTVTTATSTTGTATVTTTGTALVVGDLVIGSASFENNAQMTADADTTGGAWPPIVGTFTTGGGAATNVGSATQYKILTATGTQTFNPTGGVADTVVCVYSVQPEPDPTITQAAYRWYDEGTESGAVALAAQDTAVVGDITNGDATGTLRVRLQSTNATTIPATDDWALQWEKNASGLWSTTTAADVKLADAFEGPRNFEFGPTLVTDGYGQSFTGDGGALVRASFALRKTSVPTSSMTARLYAHTGTYGAGGTGTGSALATSTSRLCTSMTTTSQFEDFTFDGTVTLTAGTPYVIVVSPDGSITGGTMNVGALTAAPTHSGNKVGYNGTTWTASATQDLLFRVYTSPSAVVPYDSPNLTNGAATTNRLTGGTGTFVAGKVSEDGLMDDLGLTGNNFTELVYALKIKATGLVDALADTYDETNQNTNVILNTTGAAFGQTFLGDGLPLARAGFYLNNNGSTPTGNITASLYDHTGTFGTSGKPGAGASPLATSAPVAATTLNITPGWVEFTFDRTFTLASGTPYVVAVAYSGGVGQEVAVGTDTTSPTHAGNRADLLSGTWTANATRDLVFRVYTSSTVAVLANGDTLRFRVLRNAATTGLTYSQVPTISVIQSTAPVGTGSGAYLWAGGTTTGVKAPVATAAGTYLYAGTATGKRAPQAQATGAYVWAGTATGTQPVTAKTGTATGAYAWAGTATGTKPQRATATGTYAWTGATTTGQRTPKAQTTGSYLWAGTAVGLRPTVPAKTGTATGTYLWAGTSTGARTPKATGTGAYVWTGATTTGVRTPKAQATGTYLWAGSSTGKRTPKATSSGTHAWDKGTVSGIAPTVGAKQGSATGGFLWAGTATGTKAPRATAAGAYAWVGSTTTGKRTPKASTTGAYLWAGGTTTGKRTPKATGLGAYLWAGTGTGTRAPKATGLGSYAYAGIGTGKRTPKATGLGAYAWAGTGTGTTTRRGTGTGAYSYAGLGTGTAPTVGEQSGTAFGGFLWAGTAAGRKVPRASATGAYAYAGTATGRKPSRGVAAGAYAYAGTATGKKPNRGAAAGAYAYAGTTTGKRTPKATSTGTYSYAGTATGREPARGVASGTYNYAGTSTGRRTPKAAAVGTYTYTGTGVGRKAPLGTSTGTYRWAGNALGAAPGISGHDGYAFGTYTWAGSTTTGRRHPKAASTGAYLYAGTSVGVVTHTGQTVGTYLYVGTAFGTDNFPDPRDIELTPGRPRFTWAGQVRTDWHGGKPRATRTAGTPRFNQEA